eukprot:m.91645 g.91645  ORF g.91645 m.91645 type:complete len:500 (+) comp13313_c0_seq2:321-1820(+)
MGMSNIVLCMVAVCTKLFVASTFQLEPAGYCQDGGCKDVENDGYNLQHRNPNEEYNKIGIEYANKGNIGKAREYFRASALQEPHRGDVWANIGLSIKDECQEALANNMAKKKCRKLLREAVACFDVGMQLGNEQSRNMRSNAVEVLRNYFPGDCLSSDCNRYKTEKKAIKLVNELKHIEAVNTLCKTKKDVTIEFSDWELAHGLISCETSRRFLIIMRVCGVVVAKDIYNQPLLDRIKSDHDGILDEFLSSDKYNKMVQNDQFEEENVASRGESRFELKFPLREPYTDPRLVAQRHMLALVKSVLGDRIELDTFSSVTSLPGKTQQGWHADVGHLFGRLMLGEHRHAPPPGLIVAVPLVDLSSKTGPTEFVMGSHVNIDLDYWESRENAPETAHLILEAAMGSAVVFDMRVKHRGTRNKSDKNRPLVYMGYVREWYTDKVNFKEKQTRAFDDLRLKKLFTRLDNRKYTEILEEIVAEETSVDLDDLRSKAKYRKVNLKV